MYVKKHISINHKVIHTPCDKHKMHATQSLWIWIWKKALVVYNFCINPRTFDCSRFSYEGDFSPKVWIYGALITGEVCWLCSSGTSCINFSPECFLSSCILSTLSAFSSVCRNVRMLKKCKVVKGKVWPCKRETAILDLIGAKPLPVRVRLHETAFTPDRICGKKHESFPWWLFFSFTQQVE